MSAAPTEVLIATNSSRGDYFIGETVEAGIVLQGTEVKSIRKTAPNLKDSFVDIRSSGNRSFEAFLLNAHIGPYSHGNILNHEPDRKRKLLLHRHQIEKLHGAVVKDGMTVIPIRMYYKSGKVKIELGVGKGKKKYDKREDLKKKTDDRDMDRAMKHSNRKR